MTHKIETLSQMEAMPIGTVLTHTHPLNGLEVAIRTVHGWEVSGRQWATDAGPDWVGADVMVRKEDLLRLAETVDAAGLGYPHLGTPLCPTCGGDVLRADFSAPGRCHVGGGTS